MKLNFSTNPKDWLFKSQRQRVSPFPNYFSMETVCNDMADKVGFNAGEILYFIQNNVHYVFIERQGYEKLGRGVADNMHADVQLASKLVDDQHKYGKILVDFCQQAREEVKSEVSNKRLYELYAEYEKKYKEVYARYGWVWSFEDFYIKDLLKIVESKIKNKTKAPEILNVLTSELTAMVATVERKAMLELALKVITNKKWVELIKSEDESKIKQESGLDKLITKHVNDYFWVTRDYEDPIIDYATVLKRLNEYLDKDVRAEYQELIDTVTLTEKERQQYLRDLDFSQSELAAINSMRQVAYLKELRKRYVSESLYYFDDVLKAIGKRLYLSLNQVRHFTTKELKQALLEDKDFSVILNERIKLSLWYCREGAGVEIMDQATASKLFAKFCAVDKARTEFTGIPVSPGIARGPVKLVMNPNECDKVQPGDIVVSIQVVPSFSTAIMKAAGLVCDGGHGITTHPATLAREAGIPGVIQTRFVREAVKDGDIVEVDGNKGLVRLIKSN